MSSPRPDAPCPVRIATLQRMAVLGGLSAETLEILLGASHHVQRAEGAVFFHEGEAGDAMYILESGAVEVLKNSSRGLYRLGRLEAGDCFGEMALMDMSPRSATVRALLPCEAIEVPFAALLTLYERNVPQFALLMMNMGREVSRRLRSTIRSAAG